MTTASNADKGMDIAIKYVPTDINDWTITRVLAKVIHSDEFVPIVNERLINFRVKLNKTPNGGIRNDGTGLLTLPTESLGLKFLSYVHKEPIKILKRKLQFHRQRTPPPFGLVVTLRKTPYLDPDIEEERQNKLSSLDKKFRIDAVQFGIFYQTKYSTNACPSLAFSVEWERDFINDSVAWLKFDYDNKLIRVTLGSELVDDIGYNIAVSFASFQKIAVGNDPKPYICFDTLTPPVLEKIQFHRTLTGSREIDNKKFKQRVGSLNAGHDLVSHYTPHLRIVLYNEPNNDTIDEFASMCQIAGFSSNMIIKCGLQNQIEALKNNFFSPKRINVLRKTLGNFDWPIAFQLESLLHNGLLHTGHLEELIPRVKELIKKSSTRGPMFVGDLLRRYNEALQGRGTNKTPMSCFENVIETFNYTPPSRNVFRCYHVTFTPTRLLLEGPYASESNRVIRQYEEFQEYFIRVDFRDEDRLQYRWDKEVDGTPFLQRRVGLTLKHGFELAGRRFEFLAYSTSALRNHAVWFMNPFDHPRKGRVNAASIRDSLGNFANTELLKCPSKYAARLAQAFTATNPSVKIRREEWKEIPDLGIEPHLFTDGIGTISKALADRIWAIMDQSRTGSSIKPSAIRFLGYKGVVVIDEQLDDVKRNAGRIQMQLRPSMRKFEARAGDVLEAEIEIARAFQYPDNCYLNRPLVMLLEDLGVRRNEFQDLHDKAVEEARTIDESISHFCKVLKAHKLGSSYSLWRNLERLENRYKMDLKTDGRCKVGLDTPFLRLLRQVAMTNILRDIKHSARIPIPNSYLLVGVADEGPAYEAAGYENVYSLDAGTIYVCIEKADSEPIYLEGNVSISRSPVAHPGDVQRVRAIGKPPQGKLCFFKTLKNVVVMPSKGPRSLASCLGGGDVDGDQFSVISHKSILPRRLEAAASYTPLDTFKLERDSTVDDICDFIVEYINSDILGLLSVQLLIIADQSSEGLHDEKCKTLAELCSHAVDYPKLGTPPNLEGNVFPKTLIRCKPDWHSAEVVSPRRTDYYESSRALGYLFRSIEINDPEPIPISNALTVDPFSNPISQALMQDLKNHLEESTLAQGYPVELHSIFVRYCDELRYICATHTLSNTPGVRLLEAEVVIGTILAKCSQKRLRKDRIYRMRLHGMTLVKDVQRAMIDDIKNASTVELIRGLGLAWNAWCLSLTHQNDFGANSFGWIAIGIIFDCLECLEQLESK